VGKWYDGQATGSCDDHMEETRSPRKDVGSTWQELRCKRMEVMWSDMAQDVRDERGDAACRTVSGGQV
jgi:hypothetical protein